MSKTILKPRQNGKTTEDISPVKNGMLFASVTSCFTDNHRQLYALHSLHQLCKSKLHEYVQFPGCRMCIMSASNLRAAVWTAAPLLPFLLPVVPFRTLNNNNN